MTPDEELTGKAVHEVSHAIVAHKLGLPMLSITFASSGAGDVVLHDDTPEDQNYMIACAAGYLGEAWWLHLRGRVPLWTAQEHCANHGSDYDQEQLDKLAQNGAGNKTLAIERADTLVRAEFHRIEEYADRLKRRGELSPDEF